MAYSLRKPSIAKSILIISGLKVTSTRILVLDAILRNGYSITNAELYRILNKKTSRSVIYRILQSFLERKVLSVSPVRGKNVRFFLAVYNYSNGSILHFQCEKCRTITISDAGLQLPFTIEQQGYIAKNVFYNVTGLCERCH